MTKAVSPLLKCGSCCRYIRSLYTHLVSNPHHEGRITDPYNSTLLRDPYQSHTVNRKVIRKTALLLLLLLPELGLLTCRLLLPSLGNFKYPAMRHKSQYLPLYQVLVQPRHLKYPERSFSAIWCAWQRTHLGVLSVTSSIERLIFIHKTIPRNMPYLGWLKSVVSAFLIGELRAIPSKELCKLYTCIKLLCSCDAFCYVILMSHYCCLPDQTHSKIFIAGSAC